MPNQDQSRPRRRMRPRPSAPCHPWQDILNAIDEAVLLLDAGGVIRTWNPAAERITGYPAEEAVGVVLADMFPRDLADEIRDDMRRVVRGEPVPSIETPYVRKDGRIIRVVGQGLPVRGVAREITGVLVIARDVTEQRQLEETAESRAQLLATADRFALDIMSSHTGVEALHDIAEAARTLTNAQRAVVTICRPDSQDEVRDVVTAGFTPEEDILLRRRMPSLPLHALLLVSNGPLRVNKPSEHPVYVGVQPVVAPVESFLGLALQKGDVLLGTLSVVNKQEPGGFTEDDESAVQALAPYAAMAIRNLLMLQRLNALVSGMMAAQEEERQALAFDLHDGLTQFVMAAHMHMEAFRAAYGAGKQERAAHELDRGLADLKKAVVESRRLVNGLRLLVLDDLGLAGAVEQLLSEEKARAGWAEADFLHNISERRFNRALETAVYRVAQEALTNARKHGGASRVRLLMLEEKEDGPAGPHLRLEVADWGCGFVPEEKLVVEGRVGLHSIQERANVLGGTCQIISAPGKGTAIRATFPLRPVSPAQQEAIGDLP